MSSSSDASVGENLDKLKELFSGGRTNTKGSKHSGISPPKELPLVKGKTIQLVHTNTLSGTAAQLYKTVQRAAMQGSKY